MQEESFDIFRRTLHTLYRHFLGPVFLYHKSRIRKKVREMYERLLACGFTEQMAMDILTLFPDPDELRTYVYFAELFHV